MRGARTDEPERRRFAEERPEEGDRTFRLSPIELDRSRERAEAPLPDLVETLRAERVADTLSPERLVGCRQTASWIE